MNTTPAARHVHKVLEAATDEQITRLAGRPRQSWRNAPDYDSGATNALRQALRDKGFGAAELNNAQDYISRRTFAAMTKTPVAKGKPSLTARLYTGVTEVRPGITKDDAQAADVEAQGVFWTLLVSDTLEPALVEHFLRFWVEAGLALPKGVKS